MTKVLAALTVLMALTGCEAIIESLPDFDQSNELCSTNKIPDTPAGASDADVEREIVEMCRDQERRR